MTNKGNVYTWGNNSYGQLGHCSKENVSLFQIPNDYGEIVQVCAGFRCTVIMNDKREMFYFGVVGNGNVNTNGENRKIDLKDKNLEVSNNQKFSPVRLLCCWNRGFSIFYVTFADIREITEKTKNKNVVDGILYKLSKNWLNDDLDVPNIPEIAKYFKAN